MWIISNINKSLFFDNRTLVHFARYLSLRNNLSGYESETAEIKDSLKKFSLFENYGQVFEDGEKISKLSHALPLRSKKNKSLFDRNNGFADFKKVNVKGGKGGDGMICFLSLFLNPMAGPSGGDGGNGAHVIFEASKNLRSLNHIKSCYSGLPGQNGKHKDMNGASAEHLIILVPVGTLIKNIETSKLIADMNKDGMKFLAAKGGAGGKGNHYFLNNSNRHPRVAEIGANGEVKHYILELKMIAHAGLVGFPNAGKSTILRAVSRAKPKVANYPFTTLQPSVGIVHYDDGEQLAIADMPGLIEEAHKNNGLGFGFLRHIERCVCLFYVIDISIEDPYQQLRVLMNELELYEKDLSKRPVAIIVNKIDTDSNGEKLQLLIQCLEQQKLSHLKLIPVSAKYGINLTQLLIYFREMYDLYRYEMYTKNL